MLIQMLDRPIFKWQACMTPLLMVIHHNLFRYYDEWVYDALTVILSAVANFVIIYLLFSPHLQLLLLNIFS